MEHVASPRVNRGWEFLLPTDMDFIKKHPDVAHRQNMLWLGIQSKWVLLEETPTYFIFPTLVFSYYLYAVFPLRLEKVFNFSKEDFLTKKCSSSGGYCYLPVRGPVLILHNILLVVLKWWSLGTYILNQSKTKLKHNLLYVCLYNNNNLDNTHKPPPSSLQNRFMSAANSV